MSNSIYCPKRCEHLSKGFGGRGFCCKYQAEIFMKYWPRAYSLPYRKCKMCREEGKEEKDGLF